MLHINLDQIIQTLEAGFRGGRSHVQIERNDLEFICLLAREVLLEDPMCLQIRAPVCIVGDLHGQYEDLLRIIRTKGSPTHQRYLFLGDYVDRGKNSLETMTLLLCYKLKYPINVYLLRGNHESPYINHIYGFYDECKRRYSTKLWKYFVDCYSCLPVAAIISNRVFCCHGGLSPTLTNIEDIDRIERPTDIPIEGILCDLLWSDPDTSLGWKRNTRGISWVFGSDIVERFLRRHDFDLICRAHQVVEDGYEFFGKRQLVTVFSAPNYCGIFDNAGATMFIDCDLVISFDIYQSKAVSKPSQEKDVKFDTETKVPSNTVRL